MEVLAGATETTIDRSHFSNVGRDQYNDCTVHQSIVQTRRERKIQINRNLPELSEFTEIKRGDIYKNKDACCSWRLCSNGKDETEAAVYIAQIMIAGRFEDNKFTVKTYRGRNAMKEWRRDFLRCSKDWCGNVPLFGFNKSSVPLLIFHGELVPLAHIEDGLTYVGWCYIEVLIRSLGCTTANQLWVDPIKGRFCRGPIGPKCHKHYDDYGAITIPADVEFLEEDVVFRYFSSKQDDRRFLGALSDSCHLERLKDIPPVNHIQVISSSTNSTIAFNQTARWDSWKGCSDNIRQVMSDGATRFRLRCDQRDVEVHSFGEAGTWLSQALSVFHAHNISLDEDLSTYKLLSPFYKLTGTLQNSKRKRQRRQLSPPIYLFFLPSLPPLYHWSFDLTGQTLLSSDMCKFLGLPLKLFLEIVNFQFSWPTKVYKALRDYEIMRGFDPATTAFAQNNGYSVFELVPVENRFQEVEEGREQNEGPVNQKPHLDNHLQSDSKDVLPSPSLMSYTDPQAFVELNVLHPDSQGSCGIQAEGSTNLSDCLNHTNPTPTAILVLTQQVCPKRTKRSLLGMLFASFKRSKRSKVKEYQQE